MVSWLWPWGRKREGPVVVRWPNPPLPLPGAERSGYYLREWPAPSRGWSWVTDRNRATVYADAATARMYVKRLGLSLGKLVFESTR